MVGFTDLVFRRATVDAAPCMRWFQPCHADQKFSFSQSAVSRQLFIILMPGGISYILFLEIFPEGLRQVNARLVRKADQHP